MKTTSFNAAHAAALGLPATLHGFTADEKGYWHEPNLPFISRQGVEQLQPARGPQDLFVLHVTGAGMAPRFPVGTFVAAGPILKYNQLIAGVYFWQWHDKQRGVTQSFFGRLVSTGNGFIVLEHDESGVQQQCALHWKEEGFALHYVDYYVSVPSR